MLNRRTLRIKVMQTLFAFEQCREASLLLSKDELADRFKPNLNSMEVQDKAVLKQQRELALTLFDKKFKGEKFPKDTDEKIVEAIEKSLDDYKVREKKDFDFLKKNTLMEIEKLSSMYHLILNLFAGFGSVAASDKRNAFKNFSENYLIKAIAQSDALKKESTKSGGHWNNRMDKVRSWFREILKNDSEFVHFAEAKNLSADEQLDILKYILRKLIVAKSAIADFFEDEDMRWSEDKEILKSMVEKSLKGIKSGGALELQKLSLEWDEDKEFVEKLFSKAAHLPEKHLSLIGQHTINWEVDRLPLTDRVILQLAIAELTQFPNIPVKVTINEYIELTKGYSTPKSKQFINGILDVISKELKSSGELKKSGRGLIDNK